MPQANCPTCNTDHDWSWDEAFNKFGFGDGDGLVMTNQVADALRAAGYTVTVQMWGMHNTVITSITKDGVELIPADFDYRDGDPSRDLPGHLVELLDNADYDGYPADDDDEDPTPASDTAGSRNAAARIQRASMAMTAYGNRNIPALTSEDVADLIADLGHLAASLNIDFLDAVRRGLADWSLELLDPDSIADRPSVQILIAEMSDGGAR